MGTVDRGSCCARKMSMIRTLLATTFIATFTGTLLHARSYQSVFQAGRAEAEIHLIPEGYVGLVSIVFRAANGDAPAYENDARLYRIPKTGILLTQRDLNVGISPAWRFFFETVDGTQRPIQLVWGSAVPDTAENRTDPTVGVFILARIRQQAGRALQCAVTLDQYFVGTRAQLLARGQFRHVPPDLAAAQYVCP